MNSDSEYHSTAYELKPKRYRRSRRQNEDRDDDSDHGLEHGPSEWNEKIRVMNKLILILFFSEIRAAKLAIKARL